MKEIVFITLGMLLLMVIGFALIKIDQVSFIGLWIFLFSPLLAVFAMMVIRYL